MTALLAPLFLGLPGSVAACGASDVQPLVAPPPPSAEPPAASPSASTASSPSAALVAPPPGPSASAPPPPPNPGSTKVTTKTDAAWAACHRSFEAKARDVSKDVAAMAAACAKVTKMQLVGKTITGKQGAEDPPQSFPLKAEANHCYRVYAQAAEGIKDLDLVVKDSTGAVAGEDSTDDPSPVVAEDGAVCFKEADAATVVVSVGMGKGAYALQIWKD